MIHGGSRRRRQRLEQMRQTGAEAEQTLGADLDKNKAVKLGALALASGIVLTNLN